MPADKGFSSHSTSLLLLKLLETEDMYGYQMIEELKRRSDHTFAMKAGTLYPLLHELRQQGLIEVYEKTAESGRKRKYYSLTEKGHGALEARTAEWRGFSTAVNKVLGYGGAARAEVY